MQSFDCVSFYVGVINMRKYPKRNINHLTVTKSKHIQINIDDINCPPEIFIDGNKINNDGLVSVNYKYRTHDTNFQPHSFDATYYEHTKGDVVKRSIGESNGY